MVGAKPIVQIFNLLIKTSTPCGHYVMQPISIFNSAYILISEKELCQNVSLRWLMHSSKDKVGLGGISGLGDLLKKQH